ncbi:MAG: DUF2007 domain-containing protein [bacterium]|nr:DUF2007 domain-containing protein [bacterium]
MQQILLKSFSSVMEAELAKNLLQTSGISSVVQKKGLEWAEGAGGDVAGADLFILEKDAARAKEILNVDRE